MERSRTARKQRARSRTSRIVLGLGILGTIAVIGAVVVLGARALGRMDDASAGMAGIAMTGAPSVPASMAATAGPSATNTVVELPNVTGKSLTEAELVLTYAGFKVATDGRRSGSKDATVVAQSPGAGTKLAKGEQVTLTCATVAAARARHLVVCIDPGHQVRNDPGLEAVGPGAKETKERASGGAVGAATGRPEYAIALEISNRVRTRLEAADVQVVMTRTGNNVSLSNVERARIANQAGADLFVRIHADGAADIGLRGVSALYPGGNAWVAPITERSRRAASAMQYALVACTGATDHGVVQRSDLAGFNWSRVPAILVETGYLSNADDDRALASPAYQDKVADGVTRGILAYLGD